MDTSRIQSISHTLIAIIATGFLLKVGSTLIIPIIFAILISIFLNPIDNKLRTIVKVKWISIVLSFLTFILPILLVTTLFSFQLMNIMESLPSISEGIAKGFNKLISKFNEWIPFMNIKASQVLTPGDNADLKGPLALVGQGLISSSTVIGSTGLIMVYSFLLLYYKHSFKTFILYAFDKENRPDIQESIFKINETVQSYVGGTGLVILILSVLNSIGLSIIGIDHAIFWGTLAGFLAIIPFVGTLIGGMLPFVYALSSADLTWQPYAVIIYYVIIQQIEGNFITPKIVGDKVDINPLFAILSLVFFASFWGVSGVILALPLISILKIFLAHFDTTKPLSVLMSADINNKKAIFKRLATRRDT